VATVGKEIGSFLAFYDLLGLIKG